MLPGLESPMHILLILVVVLVFFGAKRIPEFGRSLGRGINEFKEGLNSKEEPTTAEENRLKQAVQEKERKRTDAEPLANSDESQREKAAHEKGTSSPPSF